MNDLFVQYRESVKFAMKTFILILFISGISLITGFLAGQIGTTEEITPYCAYPTSIESYVQEEVERWRDLYKKAENQWLACTQDLARISDECNADTICNEQVCN